MLAAAGSLGPSCIRSAQTPLLLTCSKNEPPAHVSRALAPQVCADTVPSAGVSLVLLPTPIARYIESVCATSPVRIGSSPNTLMSAEADFALNAKALPRELAVWAMERF
jgi:hypothetical protein